MPAAVSPRTLRLIAASLLASIVAAVSSITIPPAFVAWGIVLLCAAVIAYTDTRYRRVSEFASLPALAALAVVHMRHPTATQMALTVIGLITVFCGLYIAGTDEFPTIGFADVVVLTIAGLGLSDVTSSPLAILAVVVISPLIALTLNGLPARAGGQQPTFPLAAGLAVALVLVMVAVIRQAT